ncbi:hypothetical protein ABZ611_28685 [Streptomyces sp. NPDC007861]|uniref:hypothetical protein n=1 Tax=Streptomyces sp. NPDC007861 TaxID=3154893 RepID=UPI0033D8D3D0
MSRGAPPPVRCTVLRLAATVSATMVLLTGCAEPERGVSGQPGPSPRTTPSETLCTRVVAYWGHRLLAAAGSGYGDYQSMGLSNAQYDILRAALDTARAEQDRNGPDSAHELMDRQIRQHCTDRHRSGTPTGDPWQ